MKILIVEDDVSFATELRMQITEMNFEISGVVKSYEEANHLIETSEPDLIICDYYLSSVMTGGDLAKVIRNKSIPIVFITAYAESTIYDELKKYRPAAFLVKPFDKLTLLNVIEKSFKYAIDDQSIDFENVYIRNNGKLIKVAVDKIRFVKSEGNYNVVHCNFRKFVVRTALKSLLRDINSHNIIQVHKSYLINLKMIDSISISKNQLVISDQIIPIGRSFKEDLLSKIKYVR